MLSQLSNLWGRITGADVNQTFPQQQGQSLDRVGDMFVAYPYGLYANLPNGQLFKVLDEEGRVVMGVTVERIVGVAQNEVTLFHPITNSKIHFKNNGDIDIDTLTDVGDDATQGNINVTDKNLNITCTEDVEITCINATVNATSTTTVNTNITNITSLTSINVNTIATTLTSTGSVLVTTPISTITGATNNLIATSAVNITSPLTTITGDLTVTGNTILGPSLIAGGKELVNHLHPAGTPPGNTGVNT